MSVASITYAQKPAVPVGTTLLAAFAVFLTGFWGFTVLTFIPVLAQIGIEAAVTAMGLGKGALIGPQMAVTTIADCGCLFAADRLMNRQAFPTAEMGQATRRQLRSRPGRRALHRHRNLAAQPRRQVADASGRARATDQEPGRNARERSAFRQAGRTDRLRHLLGSQGRERGSRRRLSRGPR